MKYLQLYDHNGNLVMEHNVYVEGGDFAWTAAKPTAIWLGTILLSDKKFEKLEPVPEEKVVEPVSEVEVEVVPEPEPEPEPTVESKFREAQENFVEGIKPKERELPEPEPEPIQEEVSHATKRTRKTGRRQLRPATPDIS